MFNFSFKNSITLMFCLFVVTMFLGIGYAQISDIELDLNGSAQMNGQTGVIITDATYKSSNNADSENSRINTFFKTNLNSTVVLNNNSNSSITYTITIKNLDNDPKQYVDTVYDNDFYDNNEITFELSGLDNSVVLNKGESVTFDITFMFKDTKDSYSNTILNSYLNFKFGDVQVSSYTITYNANGGYFGSPSVNLNSVVYTDGSISSGSYIQPLFTTGSFRGWYTTPECTDGTEFDISSYSGGNITVYAKSGLDRASFNVRSLYRQLHDGSMPDGTRYKSAIVYLKRADELPDWMVGKNWWNLGTGTKVVGEYQWLYGNNGENGATLPIVFWIDQAEATLYWYSEDSSPKVTYTNQYGTTMLFNSFNMAEDLSGASYWDMSQMDSIAGMCSGCYKLKNLDFLKYWDVSNVTNMKDAFRDMTSLEDASGINDWNINNVTDFTEMFRNTSARPTFNNRPGSFQSNGTYVPD